jgi:hypothetical protein
VLSKQAEQIRKYPSSFCQARTFLGRTSKSINIWLKRGSEGILFRSEIYLFVQYFTASSQTHVFISAICQLAAMSTQLLICVSISPGTIQSFRPESNLIARERRPGWKSVSVRSNASAIQNYAEAPTPP